MGRYLTEYGTVVETDDPQKGWKPTDRPLSSEADSSLGDYAKTAGEGFASGALDAFTAPARLLTAAGSKALGTSDPFEGISGRGFLSDMAATAGGAEAGSQYDEAQHARAEANPTTATLGTMAGTMAGALAGSGVANAAGRGVTGALGGGLGARLAGAGVAGALDGAPLGLAQAGDQAWLDRQKIDGQHALAAAGLGALLGGTLSFATRGAAEVFGAAGRGVRRAADGVMAEAPEEAAAVEGAPASGTVPKAAPVGEGADLEIRTPYGQGKGKLGLPKQGEDGSFVGAGREEEDIGQALQYSQDVETINNRNRVEKVDRLLNAVPEGAHPDWVLNMTPTQRRAMADFVGVPEASDTTWQALSDAVADREGVTLSSAPEASAAAGEAVSGTFAKAAEQAADPTRKGAYKAWQAALKQMATAVLKKGAGKLVGTVLGSTHGPLGAMVGHQVGAWVDQAAERLEASGALETIVTRGAKAAGKALDGALALGRAAEQPAMRLTQVAGRAAVPAAIAVFSGKHETPEDAFAARSAELADLSGNNGQGINERVQASFGPLANDHPGAVMAATETAHAGVAYLLSKLPAAGPDPGSFTPTTSARVPERTEINRFARIYSAVMQPKTVLADVKRGIVTTDQLNAVRTVYPQWYEQNIVAQLGPKLQRRDARREPLTPLERNAVSMMTGVRTGIDSPDLGIKLGPIFDVKGPGDKPSKRVGKSKYADNYATTTNDLLSGSQ